MQKVSVELENCYGIKSFKTSFDFSSRKAYAIYAQNGAMKTSLARTFQDIANGVESRDLIFKSRVPVRIVLTEDSKDLAPESVLVINSYDEMFGNSSEISTLLVNNELREKYQDLLREIQSSKESLNKALKVQSGLRAPIEEICAVYNVRSSEMVQSFRRLSSELNTGVITSLADIKYDALFNDKVVEFLKTRAAKEALRDYIEKYDQLLAKSVYFKKGFNYYNASTVAKTLGEHGFFTAKHTVTLNGESKTEIDDSKVLQQLIETEKAQIETNADLREKLNAVDKLLVGNKQLREFQQLLSENRFLLPLLADREELKKCFWRAYADKHKALLDDYLLVEERTTLQRKSIEEAAVAEKTHWEAVIEMFNNRFFVPFRLVAHNKSNVIVGVDSQLTVGFIFEDGGDRVEVGRGELLSVLSMGEKKALYILNVLFEIEKRRRTGRPTLLIVDDIADSFDYKNKYAIVEYLNEISRDDLFRTIILTHNFDFFRTVKSRFLKHSDCAVAVKGEGGLCLEPALSQNVFIDDWKKVFHTDKRKRIASIPFIRNLLEYTRGTGDPGYAKLTALLHLKPVTKSISNLDLDQIYSGLFASETIGFDGPQSIVWNLIFDAADECLDTQHDANLENKVVLSIAIRLLLEQYLISEISDAEFVSSISSNQTKKLTKRYSELPNASAASMRIIERVNLMTPEMIHINSFMYEPLIDLSDSYLRKLYHDVKGLNEPMRVSA